MSSNTLATPTTTAGFDVNAHFRSVMNELGLSPEDTGGSITFVGEDPIFHHRANPLRRTGPTRPAGEVLRNQALLGRPDTRGARVKQSGMEGQVRGSLGPGVRRNE